ncbi:sugar ABC transporter substrate-binding protein [Amycolatopsis sp. NPDC005232]|uniref:ABC transporter substrate-binding protein n=1 Tax=Amycolatopsis sp. NPDC005232 TaxID=3157027 RepID=UPI0033B68CC0
MRPHPAKAAAVLMLTAASLAACGKGSGDAVTLWMYPVIEDQAQSRAFWQKVATGFEREYGVDLDLELQPWAGREEKLGAALMAGDGPDVVLLQSDMIPQYVAEKALQPVDDVLAGGAPAYSPQVLDALRMDGQSYGVPLYRTVTTTVYNRKLFADAGITQLPRTWDEVEADAPKLAARGIPIVDYSGSTEDSLNLTFYPLLWQAGGHVFTADGTKSAFAGAEGVSALRFLVDLEAANGLPEDVATKRSGLADDAMATGRAAMSPVMTEAAARNVIAAIGARNTAIGAPLRNRSQVTFGTPGALSLLRGTKKPVEARELLAYLTSPTLVGELCADSGFFTPWPDSSPPSSDDVHKSFARALPFTSAGDAHPQARKVMGLLAPHLQAALLGDKTPEAALTDAAEEVDSLLGGG